MIADFVAQMKEAPQAILCSPPNTTPASIYKGIFEAHEWSDRVESLFMNYEATKFSDLPGSAAGLKSWLHVHQHVNFHSVNDHTPADEAFTEIKRIEYKYCNELYPLETAKKA